MKTKDNLESEKQEKNNQMDQDYWAEKESKDHEKKNIQ